MSEIMAENRELMTDEETRKKYGERCFDQMAAFLQYRNGWTTRKELEQGDMNPRMCRLGRQHSKGQIICGQLGYRLTSQATLEEIHEAASGMKAQATALMNEVQELWRVINKRVTPAK